MTSDQTPDPGKDSPETVYKPGNPGGNWTPEEIDATRHGPWSYVNTMLWKYLQTIHRSKGHYLFDNFFSGN